LHGDELVSDVVFVDVCGVADGFLADADGGKEL
jgi:hypothetical protein